MEACLEWFLKNGKRGTEDSKYKQYINFFEEFCSKGELRNEVLSGDGCRIDRCVFIDMVGFIAYLYAAGDDLC